MVTEKISSVPGIWGSCLAHQGVVHYHSFYVCFSDEWSGSITGFLSY